MGKSFSSIALCLSLLLPGGILAQGVATTHTRQANSAVRERLDFSDRRDFEDATRGFIATVDAPAILNEDGSVSYTLQGWDFLKKEAPETANPSLWRQCQLNCIHGLFEVVPGKIYQVRGFDLANMTFVRSDNGWVIIDVLTAEAPARAGYELVRKHVGDFPVKAVVLTHPHADHYGGIEAIRHAAPNKEFEVIAPEGFMEAAQNENIMAGAAMGRRATYMYGLQLEPDSCGFIGTGLGQTLATGPKSIARPTDHIGRTGEKRTVDGLEMEFIFAPESEAPVEIMIWFPQLKAFCTAEDMTHNLHNLLTLRGAKVRNGLLWSKHVDTALRLYGQSVEVSFSTHHWPTWGNGRIVKYWEAQRDLYRYLHDQTLRMANRGLTPNEIAGELSLPASLDTLFHCRGYYGTVSHNVKSQYELYFGWFDGNPANLNPLPPSELGARYVGAMGGAEQVLRLAREAYDKGDYRWVATLLNNLVFAEPDNRRARALLADTYTQLGYQAESGPWRNFYLSGARDLVTERKPYPARPANERILERIDTGTLLDFCAIQINGEKASGRKAVINLRFTDTGEQAALILCNGVLSSRPGYPAGDADLTLELGKKDFIRLFFGKETPGKLRGEKRMICTGNGEVLEELLSCIDPPRSDFNIVLP